MNRRAFIQTAGAAALSLAATSALPQETRKPYGSTPRRKGKSVMGMKCPPLERVRVGFIGVGARGPSHVDACLHLEGVEVAAICDLYGDWAANAVKQCTDKGRPAPAVYTNGPKDYLRMLERKDIDVVVIATPWHEHVPMAVATMLSGKHALTEVPVATTIEDCWLLVDTAEKTQRHCMMLENVNYGREELMVLNMVQKGVFGELLHGEAAYIHDLRGQMHEIERGTGSWRTLEYTRRNGNLYPTHGLGPVAWYLGIHKGDRFDYMSSVGSASRVRAEYAKKAFPEGHARRNLKFVCNDINTSIIRTVKGRTIMVQWDEQLPRPYSRLNLLQGTKGCFGGFPNRVVIEGDSPNTESWEQGKEIDRWYARYDHPWWTQIGNDAVKYGGHGGMDFVMMWRVMTCLREGSPLDQDVYDAAAWSSITPLSEWSVANRGSAVDIPDFTRGGYKV